MDYIYLCNNAIINDYFKYFFMKERAVGGLSMALQSIPSEH